MAISTRGMTYDEWRQERRKGIGGSDVASIMGLNPYRSAMAVYLEKIGESTDNIENESMYWGTVLEDVVAKHYASVNGVKVRKNNHILINYKYPFALANIDRDVISQNEGRFGFEAKTTGAHNKRQWEDGGVPIGYVLQVQHYMAIVEYPHFDIGCLVGGNCYIQRRITRDEELINQIMEKEAEFWEMVETKSPPAWDGSQNAWEVLKRLYPDSEEGKIVRLPQELLETLSNYNRLDCEIKSLSSQSRALEKQRDAYKQTLCSAIGDAETGILGNTEISYKTTIRKGYTTQDTKYRTFKIKEMEGA